MEGPRRQAVLVMATVAVLINTPVCMGQVNHCFPGEELQVAPTNFARNVENFGLDFFRQLTLANPGSSLFLSPYSVWSALTLAYFGSKGNTKAQFDRVMGTDTKTGTYFGWGTLKLLLESDPTGVNGARFKSSNVAYFSDQLQLDACLKNIITDLRQIDFTNPQAARSLINGEVNRTTEGRIPELIDQLSRETRFALVNAVFFRGLWEKAFRPELTREQDFLVPPGVSDGRVQMMVALNETFKYGESTVLDARVLELPYRNSSFSMFVFLPKTFSTASILNNLNPQTFSEVYSSMIFRTVNIVGLPKFKLTSKLETELISTISRMGISDVFDPTRADLTDFTRLANLFIDKAIHQATVEVTEEGTVAAAATVFINTRFGGPGPIQDFVVNRPFVFTITDKASAVTLFAGHVVRSIDLEKIV